jgi:hypothetical protein
MSAQRIRPRHIGTLAIALAVGLALAAPVTAAQLKVDRAWGSGTRVQIDPDSTPPYFEFNASSNADGSSPTGSFIFKTILSTFTGTIQCLDVNGKTATLVGRIGTATGGFDGAQGTLFVTVVVDNGTATRKHPSPDTMSGVTFGITDATVEQLCADPYGHVATDMFSLVSGDLTVIDR